MACVFRALLCGVSSPLGCGAVGWFQPVGTNGQGDL